jgi:hypothetical protein
MAMIALTVERFAGTGVCAAFIHIHASTRSPGHFDERCTTDLWWLSDAPAVGQYSDPLKCP